MRLSVLIFLAALPIAVAAIPPVCAVGAEAPIAPEVSPPGDIPDSQVFITHASKAGYSIKVPEGWAKKDDGASTVFNDKYNHITLRLLDAPSAVDETYAKSTLVPELEKTGHAINHIVVSTVKLKAGRVVKLAYDSNSEPNAVTDKQVREENEKFFYAGNGKLVELTLSAPKGADNVDQWKLISSSFRWK
jgi:hypothetical protein